jgi:hypothetical protein
MYSAKIELDKFYTKPNIVENCISCIDFNQYDLVIEPSAGSGSFYNVIPHNNKIGLDLLPENQNIIKCDWFEYQIDTAYEKVLIIGNPPFGKRNKLSRMFLEHSSKFINVYTIAFILPDVYNKHTLQKFVPKEFRLKTIMKLDRNSFTINGKDYHVPCSFFVFEKSIGTCLRFDPDAYKETDDWTFGKPNDYDFFVMGASINTVKDVPTKNNRGYYIKVKSEIDPINVRENFKKMKIQNYSSANGGVAWVTKPELVKNYLDNKRRCTI